MANIIETINQIGTEIDQLMEKNDSNEFFKQSILLYSLTENLLRFLVATKICWVESCKQIDELDKGKEYEVDFKAIRYKAKNYTFSASIEKAKALNLISNDLKNKLHELRKERNDLIHELYLFQQRNNLEFMRKNFTKIKSIVIELISIFEKLIFEEIGVDTPEVLETL